MEQQLDRDQQQQDDNPDPTQHDSADNQVLPSVDEQGASAAQQAEQGSDSDSSDESSSDDEGDEQGGADEVQPASDAVDLKRKNDAKAGSQAKKRWARKQAEDIPASKYQRPESQSGEYNIWYHRYMGDQHQVRERATTRCDPERDSGLTRADGSRPDTYICLYFAKGCCVQGKNCNYLHRIPSPEDNDKLDLVHDIFGRKRHQTDREDMGGVGCFSRESKTLYIGNIPIDSMVETYKLLAKHFGKFGPIEQINVKPKHGCCFVRYVYRANAEFAKVAMAEQPLDGEEQLNIRWAYDDPNPRVIKQVQNEKEQRVVDALRRAGYSQEMARYNAPADYRPANPAAGKHHVDPNCYPDTSVQFPQYPQLDAQQQQQYNDAYAQYYAQYQNYYGAQQAPYAGVVPPAASAAPVQQQQQPPAVDKFTPMTRETYLAQQRASSTSR